MKSKKHNKWTQSKKEFSPAKAAHDHGLIERYRKTKQDINEKFARAAYQPKEAHELTEHFIANYYGLSPRKNQPDRRGLFVDAEERLRRTDVFQVRGLEEDTGLGKYEYEHGEKGAIFQLLDKCKVTSDSPEHPADGYFFPPQEGKPVILAFHGNLGLPITMFSQMLPLAIENGYGLYIPGYRCFTVNEHAEKEEVSEKPFSLSMLDDVSKESVEDEKEKVFFEEASAENMEKDALRAGKFLEDQGIAHKDTYIYGMCLGTWPATALAYNNSTNRQSRKQGLYGGLVVDSPIASSHLLVKEEIEVLAAPRPKKDEENQGEPELPRLKLPPLVTPGVVARVLDSKHEIRNEEYMRSLRLPVTVMLSKRDTTVPTPHHRLVYQALPKKSKNNGTATLHKTPFKGHVAAAPAETANVMNAIIHGWDESQSEQHQWMYTELTAENMEQHLTKALEVYMEKYTKDLGEKQRENFQNLIEGMIYGILKGELPDYEGQINLPKDKRGFQPWLESFYEILDSTRGEARGWQYAESIEEISKGSHQGKYEELLQKTFDKHGQKKMREPLKNGILQIIVRKFNTGSIKENHLDTIIDKIAQVILDDPEMLEAVGEITPTTANKGMGDLAKQALHKIDQEIKEAKERPAEKNKGQKEPKGKEKLAPKKTHKPKRKEKHHRGHKMVHKPVDISKEKLSVEEQIKAACDEAIKQAGLNPKERQIQPLRKELQAYVTAQYDAQKSGKKSNVGVKLFTAKGKRVKGWRTRVQEIADNYVAKKQEGQLANLNSGRRVVEAPISDDEGEIKKSRQIRKLGLTISQFVQEVMKKSEGLDLSDNTKKVVTHELVETIKEELGKEKEQKLSESNIRALAEKAWEARKEELIYRKSQSARLPVIDHSTVFGLEKGAFQARSATLPMRSQSSSDDEKREEKGKEKEVREEGKQWKGKEKLVSNTPPLPGAVEEKEKEKEVEKPNNTYVEGGLQSLGDSSFIPAVSPSRLGGSIASRIMLLQQSQSTSLPVAQRPEPRNGFNRPIPQQDGSTLPRSMISASQRRQGTNKFLQSFLERDDKAKSEQEKFAKRVVASRNEHNSSHGV